MSRFLLLALWGTALASAADTTVVFDPANLANGPFPSDVLTVPDVRQKTGLRLNMAVPDCGTDYTTCQEYALLDQYDGFSLRARAQVRFSGPVDTGTLAGGIFFVALENLTADEIGVHRGGDRVPVNQAVYDPATNTFYAKPDSALDQHRRYALVVTDAVRDAAGAPVGAGLAYQDCLKGGTPYCSGLALVVNSLAASLAPRKIVAASVFTTMSATSWLESARALLPYAPPFAGVEPGASFRVPEMASAVLHGQTGTNPERFSDLTLPLDSAILTGLERIVIGSFLSPNFLEWDRTIRSSPTGTPLSLPDNYNRVYFNALLPSAPKPAAGYPVVIFGHGFGDSRFGGPTAVAPTLGRAGFAVIAINAAGHGFGPLSSITFIDKSGNATSITAGGRSTDLDGDGAIAANEGCAVLAPVAFGTRDCFRQTVVDLMQLARAIQLGLDLDGDGVPDLDSSRVYYAGQSLGAIYGTMFTALEPTVRAGALNVGGATILDISRWSQSYRPLANAMLALRTPPLLNLGAGYNEDYVLRDQPVKVVNTPGAIAIQNAFERLEWLSLTGDAMSFAPHLKLSPLPAVPVRPVMFQFARGDRSVPNPTNSALIRAAGLQANAWEYRHDIARLRSPDLPQNPHAFLVLFVALDGGTVEFPGLAGLAVSLDAQTQLAGFFASGGATIPDPNSLSRLLFGTRVFEQPETLPETLGY